MTNATIAQPSSAPIAKLYRMCGKYNAHSACKGAFETHSVCSCPCHAKTTPAAPKAKTRKAKVAAKPAQPAAKLTAETTWQSVVSAVKPAVAKVATAKPAAPAAAIRADKAQPKVRLTFADGTSIELSTVVAVSLV